MSETTDRRVIEDGFNAFFGNSSVNKNATSYKALHNCRLNGSLMEGFEFILTPCVCNCERAILLMYFAELFIMWNYLSYNGKCE